MAGTERTVLKGVPNPCSQSPLLLEADKTPQFSSVNQVSLKSKVLKFGSLESGDMHLQEDPLTQGRPAPEKSVAQQETQSKVPHFDVWEGEVEADYNQCFDNVEKNNNIGNMLTPKQSDAPQLKSDDCEASDSSDNQQDDRIDERVRPLAKADDQQDYVGGRRSTVDQNGIPISIIRSETLLWEKSKLMQLNEDMHLRKDPSAVILPPPPPPGYIRCERSSSYSRGNEEFIEPFHSARFPLLDEDLNDERGWPLLPDYGGGRRITVNQNDNNNVGPTRLASRGFPISIPLQTESNLMQSNIEATTGRIPNNLSTNDSPDQVKKNGSWFSCFGIGLEKTTNQNNKRKRDK